MTTETEYDDYYDQIIGATITAVHNESTDSLWIHLSDGSMIEIAALSNGGFDVEMHQAETSH